MSTGHRPMLSAIPTSWFLLYDNAGNFRIDWLYGSHRGHASYWIGPIGYAASWHIFSTIEGADDD